ncbi:hypothetical protein KKC88_06305 [Patescibacteria group bacterium]|nr:hypothetical protein [Patescibacteria group bacterium]MBU1673906.1 hypothetical protein [Patescibacteria group bacterium]MBU1963421.1 hypothetical protein [Patescibacteria group bacterium]
MAKKKKNNNHALEGTYLAISFILNVIIFILLFTPYSFSGYAFDFYFYFIAGIFSIFGIYMLIRMKLKKRWVEITGIIVQVPALVAILFAFLTLSTPYASLGSYEFLEPMGQELVYSQKVSEKGGIVNVYKSYASPYGMILYGKQPIPNIPFLEKTLFVEEGTIFEPIDDPSSYDEKELLRCNLKVYLKKDVVRYFEIIFSEELSAYSMKLFHSGDSVSDYLIQCEEANEFEIQGEKVTAVPWFTKLLPSEADIYFTPEEEYIVLVNGMVYKFSLIEGNDLSWRDFQISYSP